MKTRFKTFIVLFVTAVALLAHVASAQIQTCTTGIGNGALKITSFPSRASVSVDGVDSGKTTPI